MWSATERNTSPVTPRFGINVILVILIDWKKALNSFFKHLLLINVTVERMMINTNTKKHINAKKIKPNFTQFFFRKIKND